MQISTCHCFPAISLRGQERTTGFACCRRPECLASRQLPRGLQPFPTMRSPRCARQPRSLSAEPHPYLNCGDRVRIVAGPLAGLEGILVRRKQECRVVLSIEAIPCRSVAIEVSEFEIEPMERS